MSANSLYQSLKLCHKYGQTIVPSMCFMVQITLFSQNKTSSSYENIIDSFCSKYSNNSDVKNINKDTFFPDGPHIINNKHNLNAFC